MEREIKFRAWDKTRGKMVDVAKLGISVGSALSELTEGKASSHYERYNDQIEVMQFTGLRDKEGREIYEDDIVEGEWGSPARVAWAYAYSGPQWCTVDREGVPEDFYGGIAHIGGTKDTASTRVLGNIYENPDLLEASSHQGV